MSVDIDMCDVCGEEKGALIHTDTVLHPDDAEDGLTLHAYASRADRGIVIREYETLKAGDRVTMDILSEVVVVEVLRDAEDCKDIFGRPMRRLWCKRDDTGREGWVTYGPGGAFREVIS